MSFNIFDEDGLKDLESADKQSLDDIGLDQEEKDKVVFEASKSLEPADLRVNYSEFENHIFFGSAFWAVNFAFDRVFDNEDGYPWDGTLQDKNEWRKLNSGFENWFFDNAYPRQFGYANFDSGSNTAWVSLKDHEGKLNPESGSFTVEMMIRPHASSFDQTIAAYLNSSQKDGWLIEIDSSENLSFKTFSGSSSKNILVDYSSYVDNSHHLAVVYNTASALTSVFIDGELKASSSFSPIFENIANDRGRLEIGNFPFGLSHVFSGSIDDFRFWKTARPAGLIKRNYFRDVHSNPSASLAVYYKFDETDEVRPNRKVIDWSGNGLHAEFSGNFNNSIHKKSGSLASWFRATPEPIFNIANTRVSGAMADWRASGSFYDKENRNMIFNIVPGHFIDEPGHEDMQKFLLLIARHFDRLKLYIQHLSNVLCSDESDYDNAPDRLLNTLANNYGMDISGIYEASDPLQYFFGEEILSTGSIGAPLQKIRNQLRRNLVNNLIYVIKTKSTRESLEAGLRALGLDTDVVNINEHGAFSGGIETTYRQKTNEERVARLRTGSIILPTTGSTPSVSDTDIYHSYEVRFLAITSSSQLTSSIFTIEDGSGVPSFWIQSERENLTSSYGKIKFRAAQEFSVLSSSRLPLYDNRWVNVLAQLKNTGNLFGKESKYSFNVGILDTDEIGWHFSSSENVASQLISDVVGHKLILGSSGSNEFDGFMHEYRHWRMPTNLTMSAKTFEKHTKDYESLAADDFLLQISNSLEQHLKLNDLTGSATGQGNLHDWTDGNNFSTYSNFSSSAQFNFPGKYIEKLEQSYTYDTAINNKKIRIKNTDVLEPSQITKDIPFLSVDVSPVTALNKNIIKWFGDLEKFNDIVGQPYYAYRDNIEQLNGYRSRYFQNRHNSKIDVEKFLDLIKWFDSNFTGFVKQLVPLDLISSISNFVIEPHIFEYNKVDHIFPFKQDKLSNIFSGTVKATASISAVSAVDLGLADPGRFGSAVSSSAEASPDNNIVYSASFSGAGSYNYEKRLERFEINERFAGNDFNWALKGFGNGFYTLSITGSDYEKDILNYNSDFDPGKVHFKGDAGNINSLYLTSSQGDLSASSAKARTGSFVGVQDKRWLYANDGTTSDPDGNVISFTFLGPTYDFGISYGGVWGQLPFINNKSIVGNPAVPGTNPGFSRGLSANKKMANIGDLVEIFEVGGNTQTVILWPTLDSYDGKRVVTSNANILTSLPELGEIINIENFSNLDVVISAVLNGADFGAEPLIMLVDIKFQFFDDQGAGDSAFESIFSSSITGQAITNKILENTFELEFSFAQNSLSGESRTRNFSRTLPNTKYMRTYVKIDTEDDVDGAEINFIVKGRLSNEDRNVRSDILNQHR